MASADMCEHEWPGTGCEGCKAEARERAQQAEPEIDYSYHSHEFAKAHAEPAPAQDGQVNTLDVREALEFYEKATGRFIVPKGVSEHQDQFVQGWLAKAEHARPAQTEQQPVGEVHCDGDMIWQIDGDPAVWRRLGEGAKLYAAPIAQTALTTKGGT